MGVVNGSNIDIAECGGWLKLRTLINNIAKPCPLPAFRDIERDLVVDADGLALAALLIAGPIGSASARIIAAYRERTLIKKYPDIRCNPSS